MKRTLLAFAVMLLCLVPLASATDYTRVYGKVVRANDNIPLEGVCVRVGHGIATYTDNAGRYSVDIQKGAPVTLYFEYGDYYVKRDIYTTADNMELDISFMFHPADGIFFIVGLFIIFAIVAGYVAIVTRKHKGR
jgi:hypothetical protein